MNRAGLLRSTALLAILGTSSLALAAPAHNVCVPRANGVPSRDGPPKWLDWTGTTTVVDSSLDDPRWSGATGESYTLGGARAPLHTRALWSTVAGKNYLYLSFIVDLQGLAGAGAATPRDLFVGFRRPAAVGGEHAYIFQFHLTTGAASGLVAPEHCGAYNQCSEASGTPKDFWRVFVDKGNVDSCTSGSTTVNGEKFERMVGVSVSDPPITWMTNPASPGQDAVRYWKLDAAQPPLLQNRWAVQLRLPVAAASGLPLQEGIDPGSTFWYQGSAALSTTGDLYANIGWWPRELTEPVCPASSLADYLVHPQLGNGGGPCSTCSPDNYSRLTTFAGARPADCDGGISISASNIGSMFDAPAGTDFRTVTPTNAIKATRANGTVAPNTIIAQPVNLGSTDVDQPFMARFRLATWGSTWTDGGKWKDVRGAENGVCANGSPPGCANYRIPGFVDNNHDGVPDTNNKGAITFNWTLGNDPTIGASEYCKFSLTPPGGSCGTCSCTTAPNCDVPTDTGTRATVGAVTSPCVSKYENHQCLLVELSAPNGTVNFVQQSAWNNMNFAQMSIATREALIDARKLPVGKQQKEQDIYMLVMPRNMPKALSGGGRDGTDHVRERALMHAERRAGPYMQDIKQLTPQQIAAIAEKLGRHGHQEPLPLPGVPGVPTHGGATVPAKEVKIENLPERYKQVAGSLVIMPDKDYHHVRKLLLAVSSKTNSAELNETIVQAVGPDEAADIVPTLEIYPFYQPLGVGATYMPMTAFTVFLSHEDGMQGMTWAIDGAEQVGHNIFHMSIPVGKAKKIQVRAQAIEATELLAPGNPKWPCAGGCACGGGAKNCGLVGQVGNAFPGLLAGLYVAFRGRRRRRAAQATTPAL